MDPEDLPPGLVPDVGDLPPGLVPDDGPPEPRQGGDEDSPIGKPLRSMEDKQGSVMPSLAGSNVTQLAPFDIEGSTGGDDVMPTLSARSRPTVVPPMNYGANAEMSLDRVAIDLPPAVREGIDTVRRLRQQRESGGGGVTPLNEIVREGSPWANGPSETAAPAPAPDRIDFSPRALGAQFSAAVPFAASAAALARSTTGNGTFAGELGNIHGQLDRMEAEHPTESRIGRNASMAAQILALPNMAGAAGEALAARGYGAGAQQAARIGLGSLEGAGYGAGLSREATAGGIAHDAANGAFMGALPGVAGGVAQDVAAIRREAARGTAAAAIGQRVAAAGPTAGQLRRVQDRMGLPQLATEMERLGMTGPTMTPQQIAARADEVVAQAGPEMGRILREASASAGPSYREGAQLGLDRSTLAASLHQRVVAPLESQPGVQARRAARELNQWIDDFQFSDEPLTPELAHRAQVQLRDLAGFDQARTTISRDGYAEMRRVLGDAVDESLEQAGQRLSDPTLARRYADARRSYQAAATVADFTGPSRDTANRVVSLTDTIAATGGALAGGPAGALTGAAAAAANRWLRRREHSLAAAGLERLSQALSAPGISERIPPAMRNTLANAARRGSAVYAAAVFSALHTGTPEERAAIQAGLDGTEPEPTQETP